MTGATSRATLRATHSRPTPIAGRAVSRLAAFASQAGSRVTAFARCASSRVAPLAVVMAVATSVQAYSFGPPSRYTNSPTDGISCAVCHGNLESGSGVLRILGPSQYKPGETIELRVMLQQQGQKRWGFELTALTSANEPAGTLVVTDEERTQLATSDGRQYLKQTRLGTDAGVRNASPGWSFRWIAPPTDVGPVTFYAAGNAANADGGRLGDFIYTTRWIVGDAPHAVEGRTWSAVKAVYGGSNGGSLGNSAR
jgi:hypothetical protein